jgi:hypothetical protein
LILNYILIILDLLVCYFYILNSFSPVSFLDTKQKRITYLFIIIIIYLFIIVIYFKSILTVNRRNK